MMVLHLHRAGRVALVGVLGLLFTACATARVGQFDAFAHAGSRFTDAVTPVIDQAFETAVATDTLLLLRAREDLTSPGERLKRLQSSDEVLAGRLRILNDLKRHAALLKSYFVAMRALAQTDEASGITTATQDLVSNMAKLNGRIAAGTPEVNDFLGGAVSVAVSSFQSAALNRELQANADAIGRELDLQGAVLTAIRDQMRADLESQLTARYSERVELPYARDGELSPHWSQWRMEAFRRQELLTSLDAAADAARSLRVAYVALDALNRRDLHT